MEIPIEIMLFVLPAVKEPNRG